MPTRREIFRHSLGLAASFALHSPLTAAPRPWRLGINTYCLRFWNWNDRQLIDYCAKEKLDAIFLQDSLDAGVMKPAHWAEVRGWTKDAGLKIGIENHKDIQAWRTRQLIEAAGTDFVGSYLDTGNPVFVAEHPLTTIEELGPVALSFHLRDSVVYELPEGIAVQWVPLGEGTLDFKALVAGAAEIMAPQVHIYCKPITARPPVVLPVYSDEFWTKWCPGARSRDLARFETLAKRGRPWNKPHLMADLPEVRDKYMDALKIQQMAHMEQSLQYCRKELNLGVRWRA